MQQSSTRRSGAAHTVALQWTLGYLTKKKCPTTRSECESKRGVCQLSTMLPSQTLCIYRDVSSKGGNPAAYICDDLDVQSRWR